MGLEMNKMVIIHSIIDSLYKTVKIRDTRLARIHIKGQNIIKTKQFNKFREFNGMFAFLFYEICQLVTCQGSNYWKKDKKDFC